MGHTFQNVSLKDVNKLIHSLLIEKDTEQRMYEMHSLMTIQDVINYSYNSDGIRMKEIMDKFKQTIRDKYDECIVIEWQSPMASLYYSKEQKIFKMKNGEVIELKLLRQLRIENEKVVAGATLVGGEEDFLDGEIIDPFLLTILKDKRRNKYLTECSWHHYQKLQDELNYHVKTVP